MAISKFDQFDFLIDIVPRDELKPTKRQVSKGVCLIVKAQVWY
jgi:nuclear transcription factor Y gamma